MLGGSATMPATDGSELARKQNMVVVTVQYRLGTFGFLKLDEASIHGNYGLKDIVKALEFVQEEIGAFGGDASRVLLAGHSSGAELIKSLMMAPSTSSLFHRVALHSPPLDLPAMTPTEGNAIGSLVAQALGCEPGNGALQACVFRKSTADLIAVTAALLSPSSSSYAGQVIGFPRAIEPLRPVVDGQLISADFADAVATGSVSNAKPAIFSFTHDEACPTIYSLCVSISLRRVRSADAVARSAPAPVSEDYFPAYVYQLVGSSRAQAVLASGLYAPDGTADSTRASLIDLGTDLIWRCVATQSAYNLSSSVDVYMAEFDSGITWDLNDGAASLCEDRVSHGDDLYALFGRSSSSADFGETFERDIPLSQLIRKEVQARWAAFARGGSPNSPDFAEQWTTVDGELSLLQLGDTSGRPQATGQMQANKHAQACGLTTGLWGNIVPFDSST